MAKIEVVTRAARPVGFLSAFILLPEPIVKRGWQTRASPVRKTHPHTGADSKRMCLHEPPAGFSNTLAGLALASACAGLQEVQALREMSPKLAKRAILAGRGPTP